MIESRKKSSGGQSQLAVVSVASPAESGGASREASLGSTGGSASGSGFSPGSPGSGILPASTGAGPDGEASRASMIPPGTGDPRVESIETPARPPPPKAKAAPRHDTRLHRDATTRALRRLPGAASRLSARRTRRSGAGTRIRVPQFERARRLDGPKRRRPFGDSNRLKPRRRQPWMFEQPLPSRPRNH
jgi:hypothetical protein